MNTRALFKASALALALLSTLTGCEKQGAPAPTASAAPTLTRRTSSAALVGDGKLQPGEQCDDGNTTSGDGCSATGQIESGYLCHVPGRACSLASLCGNNVINAGEACDDGDTVAGTNGCSATCDLSLCGNGVFNNQQYPSYAQEICDDGNRVEGDGCSRLCEVEPGFACAGSPSRCVRAGVTVFNTGVDDNNRRLESGTDPHWFYTGSNAGAVTGVRNANDWPQEIQTARYMAAPLGAPVCVYQDFIIPSTTTISQFRLRLATFNDNEFDSASVNGQAFSPIVVSEPPGQPWQKNIFREFGTSAAWRTGLNRIELCNENSVSVPNAFRYLFVDAFDDRCGDGVISQREECDDGNTANNDGCSASCGIEAGYGCTGAPSTCAATCGNGSLNPGEQCDDGNLTAGDGCNASCRVEAGHACPTPGQPCVTTCGNGAIDPGELCDDGNTQSSDGCSAACRIESGYECQGAPSVCAPLCGNSRLDPGELCDDGNTQLNDGCSNACTLELGYACPTVGQPCVQSCSNGQVDPGEQCDDGDLDPGDGCATECGVEPGWSCSTPASGPSVCFLTCGNGTLDANEQCDDGNVANGDGCTQGCRVEAGYSCSGTPSTCATTCGDGVVAGTEACDNGNTTNGDGCSSTCQVEPGWRCPAPGTVCFNTCGNGSLELGESCDDGNTTNGDGCGNTCSVENGYSCSGAPSTCSATCGDHIVAGSEVCDDGNLQSGDTCSPRCLWEVGQPCAASGVCDSGVCSPTTNLCVAAGVCGNGILDDGELCDDGDTTAGDGCNASCGIEDGYSCTGNPSVCAVTCGDGVRAASEACDDGNTTAGDGCSATCTVEAAHGCKTANVHQFYTRRGQSQCTNVSSIASPTLPAGAAQSALTVPGRYRAHYVSGAVKYSDAAASWYPGIFGISHNPGAGTAGFSLGQTSPASSSAEAAMDLGFPLSQDFDAAAGDVRVALIDTDCALNNNSETAATYRVDALSICQLIPLITGPASGGYTEGEFEGTATPGTTINVYVDGSTTPACTAVTDATGHWSCTATTLPDGPHTAVVTSTELGATETSPPVSFNGGEMPTAPPVITGPLNGSTTTDTTPPITGTAEPGSSVTVSEGGTVICTATANASGQWTCTPTTPLDLGSHTITATATAPGNGPSSPSTPVTFTVEAIPAPPAPVISGPANGSFTNDSTPPISGTSQPGTTVTVREGGTVICTAVTNDQGNWTCTPTTPLPDGEHTLTATATPAGGGPTSPASNPDTFTIDTLVPDTLITDGPATKVDTRDASFEYDSTENDVRYECSLDGRAYAPCQESYDVGPGEHTLSVRAVDPAGNVDPTPAVHTWTVAFTRAFAGGGCSVAPDASWLALLGLLGLRRRKRR